jgi:hypothetical protein
MCKLCKTNIEDNEHLIHLCANVKHMLDIISKIVKFDIKWKYIFIGFYHEHNKKIVILNNFISTIATVIYKYKKKMLKVWKAILRLLVKCIHIYTKK